MRGTIRIQSVRYGGDDDSLGRFIASVGAAVQVARDRLGVEVQSVALGDCGSPDGPEATLPRSTVETLIQVLDGSSIPFEYVPFGKNLGHGGGQNRLSGVGHADSPSASAPDYLVILNPDMYLVPDALAEMLAAFRDPRVGIAEARQIPLEHPKVFDLVTGETPWASGCALALPFALFVSLGGFDPSFFLHGDDVDLSWRVRMRGHVIRHVVSAATFHDKRPTVGGYPESPPVETYQGVLSRLLLAHRAERPDVIEACLARVAAQGDDMERQGAAAFRDHQRQGILPVPYRTELDVDADTVRAVVELDGATFAEHRF
jgi:GT2 family glycosyltransferase